MDKTKIETLIEEVPKGLFINGQWQEADGGKQTEVINPATGQVIAHVANAGEKETEQAITAAEKAFPKWSGLTADERGAWLHKMADAIRGAAKDLAVVMTIEQGKPLNQAEAEILSGAACLDWNAEEVKRLKGETIPGPTGELLLVQHEPLGVVAAITPWNFPSAMITRKMAPAIAVGNTVVLKPSPETPLSALALMALFDKIGLPTGVVNIVTGDAKAIGGVLTADNRVRKLTFTGSTAVGKMLFAQSADTVKKLSLELGGHAPFIVFEDANVDKVVADLVAAKFRNNGQVCTSPNRIFVHESIQATFTEKLVSAVEQVKIANGLDENASAGPLIREDAIEKIDKQLDDAKGKGAKILSGGERLTGAEFDDGYFYKPTVITGITTEMAIFYEETFGPVLPIITFNEDDEVIEAANDTLYGLASYFYTNDIGRIAEVGRRLQYGMVGVNSINISYPQTPFGGVKHSGFGRENGAQGLSDYIQVKFLNITYKK